VPTTSQLPTVNRTPFNDLPRHSLDNVGTDSYMPYMATRHRCLNALVLQGDTVDSFPLNANEKLMRTNLHPTHLQKHLLARISGCEGKAVTPSPANVADTKTLMIPTTPLQSAMSVSDVLQQQQFPPKLYPQCPNKFLTALSSNYRQNVVSPTVIWTQSNDSSHSTMYRFSLTSNRFGNDSAPFLPTPTTINHSFTSNSNSDSQLYSVKMFYCCCALLKRCVESCFMQLRHVIYVPMNELQTAPSESSNCTEHVLNKLLMY